SPLACERFVLGQQPAGFVRMNLAPYHLVLPEVQRKVVIDAGTNEGAGAALFAKRAREVFAYDRSDDAIAAASARHQAPNLHFAVHDVHQPFPVADGSVDVVFTSEMVEHLNEGRTFFANAAKALKPGGTLIVKTPNDAYNRLENRLNPHHTNPYDEPLLRRELEERFKSVIVEGMTYKIDLPPRMEDRPERMPPAHHPH